MNRNERHTVTGCDIITGGGPGLMQAANEGAASIGPGVSGRSVGVRVELPFEQQVNPFVGQVYEHATFFSRLRQFMIVSDAFVVVLGGIGTLLEMSLASQLLEVRSGPRRRSHDIPATRAKTKTPQPQRPRRFASMARPA